MTKADERHYCPHGRISPASCIECLRVPGLTDEERDWRDRFNAIFGWSTKDFLISLGVYLVLCLLIVGIAVVL